MARARVEIKGYGQLRRQLKRLGDEAIDGLKQLNKEVADIVADTARPNIPVRSGRLKETLRTSGTARGGYVRLGKKAVPYPGPIHFGWPNRPDPTQGWRGGPIRPNPFLYEAMDRRVGEVLGAYSKYLETLPMSRQLGYQTTKRP